MFFTQIIVYPIFSLSDFKYSHVSYCRKGEMEGDQTQVFGKKALNFN